MPGPNRQKPGVFPLGSGIGLERHGCKAGNRSKPALQISRQPLVAGRLGRRSKGMQLAKRRPTHGRQFRRRVQLHRAAAQRDHAVHQGEVLADQPLDVAQEFGFTAVVVKHGLAQPWPLAQRQLRPGLFQAPLMPGLHAGCLGLGGLAGTIGQGRQQGLQLLKGTELIEADAHRRVPWAEIETTGQGPGHELTWMGRGQAEGVKSRSRLHRQAQSPQPRGQGAAQGQQPLGDGGQTIGAVVHGIEAGHHSQEHLGRTDVAGGLVAADVLLAGLEGQAQGALAFRIEGLTHQATRNLALKGLGGGKERRVGAPKTHGHPKTLGAAHGDIRPQLPHRLEQHLGQWIDRHRCNHPSCPGRSQEG